MATLSFLAVITALSLNPPAPATEPYLLSAAWFGPTSSAQVIVLADDERTTDRLVDVAAAMQASGAHHGAVQLLETVVRRHPDHLEAHRMISASRTALGDYADAARHEAIAARLEPSS